MIDHICVFNIPLIKRKYITSHTLLSQKNSLISQRIYNERGLYAGGTIYKGLEDCFKKIENVIQKYPNSNFCGIYTNTPYPMIAKNYANDGKIKLHPFIPEEELFRKIKQAKAYIFYSF